MFFGSVCSGIEAASVAWKQIGWRAGWLAEIEPFPSEVLKHHYPDTPNLGDMTKIAAQIKSKHVVAPDVLVGGTPCQAFSVAGMRDGLADHRGELTIRYVELADAIDDVRRQRGEQPAIIVWENVPGVLSSKDNAFGCFLGALAGESSELQPAGKRWGNAGCVYGPKRAVAWRVLDAQYFGLAQRRKRVFLVASARDGFDPAKILFEFEGVRRDTAPSREAGEEAASDARKSTYTASRWDGLEHPHPTLSQSHNTGGIGSSNQELFSQRGSGIVATPYRMVAFGEYADDDSASTMKARGYKDATDLICVHGTQDPDTNTELAHTLGRNQGQENAVMTQFGYEMAGTLTARHDSSPCADRGQNMVAGMGMAVRRLTPVECERLQGFPDIRKTFTMSVSFDGGTDECLGHQKSFARAETKSLRSHSNVSHAGESEYQSNARAAALSLNADQESSSEHVLVNVLIDSERQHLQLHSAGRLLLSVSTAELSDWCRLPIKSGDFVQLIARINTFAVKGTAHGEADSQLSMTCSTHRQNGSEHAQLCGHAISELVSDAGKFTSALRDCLKSTTSAVEQSSQNYDLSRKTLFSCAAAVICSCIPGQTHSGSSFDISIETVSGWTQIEWRGKPAEECPDGHRYKALGNSMAVPCMAWIGKRIQNLIEEQ